MQSLNPARPFPRCSRISIGEAIRGSICAVVRPGVTGIQTVGMRGTILDIIITMVMVVAMVTVTVTVAGAVVVRDRRFVLILTGVTALARSCAGGSGRLPGVYM